MNENPTAPILNRLDNFFELNSTNSIELLNGLLLYQIQGEKDLDRIKDLVFKVTQLVDLISGLENDLSLYKKINN